MKEYVVTGCDNCPFCEFIEINQEFICNHPQLRFENLVVIEDGIAPC